MPIHPSYDDFIANLKKTYGDRWQQVFYALCNQYGWDYAKPMPKPQEDFSWIIPLGQRYSSRDEKNVERLYIRGSAIQAGKTGNQNVYTQDELAKAARTLIDKPIGYDHPVENRVVGKVTDAEFIGDHVEYVGLIEDPEVEGLVKRGEIDWVSVEASYRSEWIVNGRQPYGIVFTGLALVPPGDLPGDPGSSIHVWESLLSRVSIEQELEEKMSQLAEKEWDAEYINDLPDDCFAVISAGGEKDEQGKTVPRTLRHLPHHNAAGDVDLPHLRNALARLDQTDLSAEDKAKARSHLEAHARELEIGEYAEERIKKLKEAWEETDEYIRSGHRDPGDFDPDSFRQGEIDVEQGIYAVFACPKGGFEGGECKVGMEVQSYLFSKEKGWTMDKAKDWFQKQKKEAAEEFAEEKIREIAEAVKTLEAKVDDERIKKVVKEGLLEDMYLRLMDLDSRVQALESKASTLPTIQEKLSTTVETLENEVRLQGARAESFKSAYDRLRSRRP